ncbi:MULTISPECIES: YbaL family putative K(+) efflux transporter [Brucella]|uniref:Potassium efflux system protein n=1 Tax=Brucella anthropi (strain ATCC 49188 / DSM 6882 / CCUG 24695 / JCM 21032 / LMG 3331 / NBRC 15819 / NCTC 12168 / Alc 37) TaxID=439375 RepID=A6X021_BRUA4|nr:MULTISPECIES: YbaL family putative K(+) efflux transporter [Brucella]ABS14575.1 potassium efflux system protein [Brucella anthropi ATCC 49188]AIK43186.1 inner membrane protein ybaL [Brucella anthropi]KAB2739307.1 Kef family K(+) transporter [Brucella anthropi]KAB2753581.1 Kef family K(+) transporter [Brucella anthropi]KAB2783513.1 Kef family K(+) transporter [Brucella anthropi]
MPHDTPLIATIVIGLCLAFIFGAIATRLKISPLVGYLLAGVIAGPHTPGFVADQDLILQLAEIGVILLMFGVGLHFSLKDLLSVKAIAVPGALAQIAAAAALGTGLGLALGWDVQAGLVFGLALSTASTVVLLRAMQERRLIDTERGRIAVGWLIVEDLAMVMALVLLPAVASVTGRAEGSAASDPIVSWLGLGIGGIILLTIAKVVLFVALMLIVGRKVIPWLLNVVAQTGSRELFRLGVLAIALGVAFGAAHLFGVSFALGAFFAGMVMSESELSHRAAEESLPLRDAFAVLFFISVGMLFDPMSLLRDPLPLLGTLAIILIGKSVAAFFIVRAFRRPVSTALTISASLAQIGEFSFILAGLGVSLNLLPPAGRDLILAGAILSIFLNPVMFIVAERMRPWIEKRSKGETSAGDNTSAELNISEPEPLPQTLLTAHTIIVGYGQIGERIAAGLQAETPFLVIEDSSKVSASLKDKGIQVITGNASDSDILKAANPVTARNLVIAIPNAFEAGRVTALARAANPEISIVVRACSKAEAQYLHDLGADFVILGEEEIAAAMAKAIGTEIKRKNTETVSEENEFQADALGIISGDGSTDIMGKKGDDMKHEGMVTG